jgi:hypothetical protein
MSLRFAHSAERIRDQYFDGHMQFLVNFRLAQLSTLDDVVAFIVPIECVA